METLKNNGSAKVILQALFFVVIMPFLPLLISGKWDWWEGWAYGLLGFFSFAISRVLAAKRHPDLIAERAKFMQHKDAQTWDKKIIPMIGLAGVVLVVVSGLDQLFGWTRIFSIWVRVLGLIILLAGYSISSYALITNRFFSGMVRLQTERGQHVVSSGPYYWVRHPGYAGGLLSYLATPLLLNSYWLFLPVLITVGLYVLRTSLEDRFLHENLTGYREYAKQVRFRLLPGIW